MTKSTFKTVQSMTALALVLVAMSGFSGNAFARADALSSGETTIGPAHQASGTSATASRAPTRDFSPLVTQYNRSTDSQKTNLLNANPGLDRVLINSRTSSRTSSGTAQTTTRATQQTPIAAAPTARPIADISIQTLPAVATPSIPAVNTNTTEARMAAATRTAGVTTATDAETTTGSASLKPQPAAGGEAAAHALGYKEGQEVAYRSQASGGGSSSGGGGGLNFGNIGNMLTGGGSSASGLGQIAQGVGTFAGMAGTLCSATNNRNCVNSIGKAVGQVGVATQFVQAIPRIPGATQNALGRFSTMGTGIVNQARTAGSQIASGARTVGSALQARRNPTTPETPPTPPPGT